MNKLVVFHPALAPYRIDFFNSLHESFNASFFFLHKDGLEQSFDQDVLKSKIHFYPVYVSAGFLKLKNLRLEAISILRREKPQIVFCSEYNLLGLLIVFYRFITQSGFKLFTTCDDSLDIAASFSGKRKIIRNFLLKHLDGVILSNLAVKEWYANTFRNHQQFIYFPIIQEDKAFRYKLKEALPLSSSFKEKHLRKGVKVLLFVGRLVREKNILLLIEAFDKAIKSGAEAFLLIVGEGNEGRALKEKAQELGIEGNVLFTGKKQGNELYALYNTGDIFVLPSIYEPFGAVTNEALLAGCFTLCSSVAGSADLIKEGVNGYTFQPSDTDDLADKITKALNRIPAGNYPEVKANRMLKSYDEYYGAFIQQVKHIEALSK